MSAPAFGSRPTMTSLPPSPISTSSSPLLSLPLELLLPILHLALLPPSPCLPTPPIDLPPSSPFQPPLPPGSPSSLPSPALTNLHSLLATSRALRSLSLPIFWSIVVVSKPHHWTDLFDRETGLLSASASAADSASEEAAVAGAAAKTRRKWVRQIWVAGNEAFGDDGAFSSCKGGFVASSGLEAMRQGVGLVDKVGKQDGIVLRLIRLTPPLPPPGSDPDLYSHPAMSIQPHLGDSLRFLFRSVQPSTLDIAMGDWPFWENKLWSYDTPVKVIIRKGEGFLDCLFMVFCGGEVKEAVGRVRAVMKRCEGTGLVGWEREELVEFGMGKGTERRDESGEGERVWWVDEDEEEGKEDEVEKGERIKG